MQDGIKTLIIAPKGMNDAQAYTISVGGSQKSFFLSKNHFFLIQKVNIPGSTLINNFLSGYTKFLVATPFDCLFFLVAILNQKSECFCDFEDILAEAGLLVIAGLTGEAFKPERICDVKIHDERLFLRINKQRFAGWVKNKYEGVYKEVVGRICWTQGSFDNGDTAKKVSLGILSEFLGIEFVMLAESKYSVEMMLNAGRILGKRVVQEQEINGKKEESKSASGKKKPKPNVTPTLPKGQKSISNFFTKKK